MSAAFTGTQIALFLVILARVGGLVLSAPIIGDPQVPRVVKAALTIGLSIVLAGLPQLQGTHVPVDIIPFVLVVVVQLLIGITLGVIARTLFWAIETAGQIVSMNAGLSNAAVLNPMTHQPDPVLSQFYTVVAGMAFLAVNGDTLVVASLARSFDLAPLTMTAFSPVLLKGALSAIIAVTALGLQIALPIAVSIIAANIVLGVVSRSLPQLNVFTLSMPLTMALGLLALIGSMAGTMVVVDHLSENLPQTMLLPLTKR